METWHITLTNCVPIGQTRVSKWSVVGTREDATNSVMESMLSLLRFKFGHGPIRAIPDPEQWNVNFERHRAVDMLRDIERGWYAGAAKTASDCFGWDFLIVKDVGPPLPVSDFATIRLTAQRMLGNQ